MPCSNHPRPRPLTPALALVTLALLAALLAALLTTAKACSCSKRTFTEEVCASPTIILGRVVARFDNCVNRVCDPINDQVKGINTYIVRVIRIVRGSPVDDGVMFLSSALNSGLCGVTLLLDRVYLFNLASGPSRNAGSACETRYSLSYCDGSHLWKDVGKQSRRIALKKQVRNKACKRLRALLAHD